MIRLQYMICLRNQTATAGAILLALMIALPGLTGCTRALVEAPNPIEISPLEYPRMFDAAILVLRDEGFVINRKDYRFGIITTRPEPSASIFEPWRRQNSTSSQVLASTLNAQRRTITVLFEPASPSAPQGPWAPPGLKTDSPPAPISNSIGITGTAGIVDAPTNTGGKPGRYLLRVEVLIERQQNPSRQMTGATAGYAVVANLKELPESYADRRIPGTYWQPISRDPEMEKQLISAIVERSFVLDRELPVTTKPATQPAK